MNEFSDAEKKKLAQNFREVVVEKKAQDMGLNADDIVPRFQNGQVQWIKREEALGQLSKQRKLVAKDTMRSLRGGENSLVGQIAKEIKECAELIGQLVDQKIIDAITKKDHSTAISLIQKRTLGIKKELVRVEDNIEITKKRDPIFQEAEQALSEMMTAKKKGDTDTFEKIRNSNKDIFHQYEIRRKSLEPYLESARHGRTSLQREYWRILQLKWKLNDTWIQHCIKMIEIPTYIEKEFRFVFGQYEECQQKHQELCTKTPSLKEDLASSMKKWDHVIPPMTKILNDQYHFLEIIKQYASEHEKLSEKSSDNRMAFTQKKVR